MRSISHSVVLGALLVSLQACQFKQSNEPTHAVTDNRSTVSSHQAATNTGASSTRVIEERLRVGMAQPFGRVIDIDGQSIDIAQTGRRTVLVFFATWCHDSQRFMHQLQHSELLGKTRIIAFGRGESVDSLKRFRTEYRLPIRFVADLDLTYYHQVTNQGIPRIIVLDEQNRVVKTFLGEIPDALAEVIWSPK